MRYVLYARKSSESEDRQVQSIDDQVRIGTGIAKERGLILHAALNETMSAKAPGRPRFATLLAMIDAGEAHGIICWNLNRLFRNSIDMSAIQYRLQTGVLKEIVTPERTYYPEDNMLLFYVEAGMSNQYVLDLRKAVLRGRASKIEKGWFPHRAPEGYINDREARTVVPDGDRFLLMRKAWDLMLTGAYTVPQVREELTRWGFRTKKSKRFGGQPISRTSLYNVFGNPFYFGGFRCGGVTHQGSHQVMVTRDEFERVQRILGRKHHAQPQKKEFAFAGLIICGVCGCLVTPEEKVKHYRGTGRTVAYRYYHCTGKRGCPKRSISEAYIEERIRSILQDIRMEPKVADWVRTTLSDRMADQGQFLEAGVRQTQQAMETARRRLDRLFEMRTDGEIDREEFAARKVQLDTEILLLESSRPRQEVEARRTTQINGVLDFRVRAYERFNTGDVRSKRQVAHLLAVSYVLTLGNLQITLHPLLDAIGRFEPPGRISESTKKDPNGSANPSWWDTADNVLGLLDSGVPSFGRLSD